jgi:hypothetical protein
MIGDSAQSSMSLGFIDRRNGRVLSSVPVADSENPLILPPSNTLVWHYIRFDYFQALLRNKALWFTRLDKQSDKSDGTYSDANAREMSPPSRRLLDKLESSRSPWNSCLRGKVTTAALRSPSHSFASRTIGCAHPRPGSRGQTHRCRGAGRNGRLFAVLFKGNLPP